MVIIPRGVSLLVDGEYDPTTSSIFFKTSDRDPYVGVLTSPTDGTGKGADMRSYVMDYKYTAPQCADSSKCKA